MQAFLRSQPLSHGWHDLRRQLQQRQSKDKNAAARLEAALQQSANKTYSDFLTGVERYRDSGTARDLDEMPVIWSHGTTRLLDYSIRADGAPVLVIPSLINRYHVVDIDDKQSFARALAARGFRVYVIDWDAPGSHEHDFTLDDYFRHRLLPILHFLNERTGSKVHLAGYCMGGLLAVALAQIMDHAVGKLLCLATPWDFHADDPALAARMDGMLKAVEPKLDEWGGLPVDVLQSFFISLQPFMPHDKFVRFAGMDMNSHHARTFVLVEDWVNDGVTLAKNVARECLKNWYVDNATAKKQWRVLGEVIDPASLSVPSLHVIPKRDKIVPPASARALAKNMKKAVLIQPPFGHISMMVNQSAHKKLWVRLFDWLAS